MHGVREQHYKNEQHEKAMTAPINKDEPEHDPDFVERVRRHM